MPSVSAKQRRFFMADLTRAQAGKKTKTGMSAGKLEEYKTVKHAKHVKSKMPHGATMSPHGDIGAYRQEEAGKAGGFKDGPTVKTEGKFGSHSSYKREK